jgi:DNA-damage-inducible protein D
MEPIIVRQLAETFNTALREIDGIELMCARDLQLLLDYDEWRNFQQVIEKAKVACANAAQTVADHFVATTRTVLLAKNARREVEDVLLTRYACYLVAQNADSQKKPVAFAMSYFAVQTRRHEILEQRIRDWERVQARERLTEQEKQLSALIYERGVDSEGFARIRSKGDQALFGGYSTADMKARLGIPSTRPLADFLPTITIKAKDFAMEISNFNIQKEDLVGETAITDEHIKNNRGVRKLLAERGIQPEALPPAEDLKKIERRHSAEEKKLPKQSSSLKDKSLPPGEA